VSEDVLNERRAEFHLDRQRDFAAVPRSPIKEPGQMKITNGMVVRRDIDSVGTSKDSSRYEAIPHHREADDLIRVIDVALACENSGGNPPWHKIGISLDIGHKIEKLFPRMGKRAAGLMIDHDLDEY
jgi:hypothetical protein